MDIYIISMAKGKGKKLTEVELSDNESGSESGSVSDSGSESGSDSGSDAGSDTGSDAGSDAGSDSGSDSGSVAEIATKASKKSSSSKNSKKASTKKESAKKTPAKKTPAKKNASKKTSTKKNSKKNEDDEDKEDNEEPKYFDELEQLVTTKGKEHIELVKGLMDGTSNVEGGLKGVLKILRDDDRELVKQYKATKRNVERDMKKLGKKKNKTKRKAGGCVTQEFPVPSKFVKYLGLEKDATITRPNLTKALYAKFKEDGLGVGNKKYEMDSNAAKAFGGKKGDEFNFSDVAGLISSVCNSDKGYQKWKADNDSNKNNESV